MENSIMLNALKLISEGKLEDAREYLEKIINEEVAQKTMTLKDKIKDRIKREFNEYKADVLSECSPEEIFDRSYQTYVLSEISEFFENENGDLYEGCYEVIDRIYFERDKTKLLGLLYDYYLTHEFASVTDYSCIAMMIENFCEAESENQ